MSTRLQTRTQVASLNLQLACYLYLWTGDDLKLELKRLRLDLRVKTTERLETHNVLNFY